MHPPAMQCLRSAAFGGAVAVIAVPVAGILPALAALPPLSDLGHIAMGAVIMAVIGAVVGPLAGLAVGFPALLILSRVGLATPLVVAALAACVATILVAAFFSWPAPSWSLVAFGSAIGVPCGLAAAVALRHSEQSPKTGEPAGAERAA